jgi:hypothetical protein
MIICKDCGHRNPNGTTFCENRTCGAFLEWSGDVQPTEQVPAAPVRGPGWGASGPSHVGPSEVGLTARLAEHELSVDPGAGVECEVTVRNTGTVVDKYALQVLGDAARWTRVDPPTVNLVPDAQGTARVTFTPPRSPQVVAGLRPFRLVATSHEDPRASAFADGTVNVGPFNDMSMALQPQIVEGRAGVYEVGLANRGNVPATVRIDADDAQGALALRVAQPTVSVPPGGSAAVRVQARPRNGRLSGTPRPYPFRVVAQTGWDAPRIMDGQLRYRPMLPPLSRNWLIPLRVLLTLLGALLMFVGANGEWSPGVDGTDLTYDNYVESAFETETPPPPESVDSIFVSVGLVPIVFAVFAVLGLASRTGLLTRLAAGFALLVMIVFAFTMTNAGLSLESGVFVVILGTILALLGGICGMVGKD